MAAACHVHIIQRVSCRLQRKHKPPNADYCFTDAETPVQRPFKHTVRAALHARERERIDAGHQYSERLNLSRVLHSRKHERDTVHILRCAACARICILTWLTPRSPAAARRVQPHSILRVARLSSTASCRRNDGSLCDTRCGASSCFLNERDCRSYLMRRQDPDLRLLCSSSASESHTS